MSEKYYVVSESELEALKESWRNPDPRQHTHDQQREAMEACRARPVKTLGGITWWPADYKFDEEYRSEEDV